MQIDKLKKYLSLFKVETSIYDERDLLKIKAYLFSGEETVAEASHTISKVVLDATSSSDVAGILLRKLISEVS